MSDAPRLPTELTLRGLRVFVALEETGSIAGAAQRIGGSSSGVSQHITALEAAIGAKLFDRRAKPVTLTPAGQVLRADTHRILSVVSEAQAELAEISLTSLPTLNLAIIDDLDASLTPVLVSALQQRFRKCFVYAFSGRSDQIIDRLQSREADIGVSALLPADATPFQSVPILREAFVLLRRDVPLRIHPATQQALTIGLAQAVRARGVGGVQPENRHRHPGIPEGGVGAGDAMEAEEFLEIRQRFLLTGDFERRRARQREPKPGQRQESCFGTASEGEQNVGLHERW